MTVGKLDHRSVKVPV
jgi:hypothetical protein